MRVPYCQQFTPEQTPLRKLLPVLRQNAGDNSKLRKAIAAAFFKGKPDPGKLAGNTLISLRTFTILDGAGKLTEFGKTLVKAKPEQALELLAKRFLIDLGGLPLTETMREMQTAGISINLQTLPEELEKRGVGASKSSSDLSGVLNWLRAAGVLSGYTIQEEQYASLVGAPAATLQALRGLNREQIGFLHAMVALGVKDWCPYNGLVEHAEQLYSGEVKYNWKFIPKEILEPLAAAGLIEIRKKEKKDTATPQGRGGKPADIKPKPKFFTDVAAPLLMALYKFVGMVDFRELYDKPLADIVITIRKSPDPNKRGKALEQLTIRLCQLLDLEFMGWRETDEVLAAGGEIDAMFHSARLIYSRWQVQCKVGPISLEAVAKEVGLKDVTLANVILVVGTERATDSAMTFRRRIVGTSNLNIILIDGPELNEIIEDPLSGIRKVLQRQAKDALKLKKNPDSINEIPPSSGTPPPPKGGPAGPQVTGRARRASDSVAYMTQLGQAHAGDSLEVLPALIAQGIRAKLIVTSPPFALVRKKDYGNEDADDYVEWLTKFIPLFKQILLPEGSLVIDIGGAWIKGLPVKSTYQFKVLLRFCENGFYLAQDFYHYNPARLPTPAEWVTVRRVRVKDAMNNVWWLVMDPFVKADNRRVLRPYSQSMKDLLRNGYTPALRPSGHDISDKFQKDNNGAIPPNLLEFANTESNSHYLRRCKEEGIKPHPARYPIALPQFFINLLTEPGDVVLDPFAGSNVTGAAAEASGRRWLSIELDPVYVRASGFRFEPQGAAPVKAPKKNTTVRSVATVVPVDPAAQIVH